MTPRIVRLTFKSMIRHIRILFAILALSITSAATVSAQTSLKVSLDSAYLLMGKATPMHVELITSSSTQGQLLVPKDTICDKVEILNALKADTSDIGTAVYRSIRNCCCNRSTQAPTYSILYVMYRATRQWHPTDLY